MYVCVLHAHTYTHTHTRILICLFFLLNQLSKLVSAPSRIPHRWGNSSVGGCGLDPTPRREGDGVTAGGYVCMPHMMGGVCVVVCKGEGMYVHVYIHTYVDLYIYVSISLSCFVHLHTYERDTCTHIYTAYTLPRPPKTLALRRGRLTISQHLAYG